MIVSDHSLTPSENRKIPEARSGHSPPIVEVHGLVTRIDDTVIHDGLDLLLSPPPATTSAA
jgi:hypothetical protein